MLIRFATLAMDRDSGYASGILVASTTLRDEGDLTSDEHLELREALSWFNEELFVPKVLERPEHRRAISWFKPAAEDAIRRMWHLKYLLDRHGHHVEVLRTSEPGSVVYEDDWQLIAKPRKGQRFW
ncbi:MULTISPECIES: hypothetical protein [unclassified Pseudoxanthomonas]|uniref:hypothetical protein n=1 Tax=unclassified Pseudoxanthomonas TaxID=2645906 RepID=UPI0016209F66|nr:MULTISPECIES: hypothetical protein [unclassified Pseudoxanthomonas]MBB3275016.1 hypothetical protein [Pseudoxanthomonas sp. OG2]MBV7473891.1 hypothetical protein [Pseudoxanthomonas sp. PXM05]